MVAFWYSLGFAVVRTLLTIFVASSINDYEKKIVTALRDVPSRAWSIEVKLTFRCKVSIIIIIVPIGSAF